MNERPVYPGVIDATFPDAYTKMPPQPTEKKPGQLPVEMIEKFFDQGFVVVENFFTVDELKPCLGAVEGMVDKLATKLYNSGKIADLCTEYGVFQRLTMLEKQFAGATVLLFKNQKIPQAFMDLWRHERLLNVIEQILGPDISGHPVWNLRTKVPNCTLFNIPWHQDNGYFSTEAYDHMIATAWIPFLDATPENGCLQMVRNGHSKGKVARHSCCVGDSWYVQLEEDDIEKTLDVNVREETVTCPVPLGGFVLFSNIIPHRSLPNTSNDVRWSVDLRWQSPHEHWGFYNIGEGVPMRSSEDPNMKPDFQKFLSVDRKEMWRKLYTKNKEQAEDEFDTTLVGPWMGRWDVVHHNRHTDAFNF